MPRRRWPRRTPARPRFARSPEARFRFTLAARLGMTVAELQARMSYPEFLAWQTWLGVEVRFANDLADKQQESVTFKLLGG